MFEEVTQQVEEVVEGVGGGGRGQALYSSLSFGAGGLLGALVSGSTWDEWGAGWTFALSSGFAFIGLLLVWRWVHEDAAVDVPGEEKMADPVP